MVYLPFWNLTMEHVSFIDKLPVEHADFSQQTVKLLEGTLMSPLISCDILWL